MGKRRRDRGGSHDSTDWSSERTLADAEADAEVGAELAGAADGGALAEDGEASSAGGLSLQFDAAPEEGSSARQLPSMEPGSAGAASARCSCGSEEFLLEAYLAVVRGRPQPEPVELEALTCPQCGREYEAIWLADGRVARGEYRGQTELDE